MELQGRTGLISGSSRGIGRSAALALAEAGSDVIVNYHSNEEAALGVVEAVRRHGVRSYAFQADVSKADQAEELVRKSNEAFGPVHILVNNAGIARDRSFMKLSREHWREVLLVNLDGVFNLTGLLLPQMVEAKWGRVINMSSIVAQMGNFGQSNYAVAKGGLIAFTKTLAREVARKSITVNAIAPGFIDTDMTRAVPEASIDIVRQLTPMGRLGTPEEVAVAVRFLSSPMASFITGQVINVNGGLYM